jgi:hypothetical protein
MGIVKPIRDFRSEAVSGYFSFLCRMTNVWNEATHHELFNYLFTIEFTHFVPNDENRAEDILDFRRSYAERSGFEDNSLFDFPPTFFELIVILAVRMDDILCEDPQVSRVPELVSSLLVNLGLNDFGDDTFPSRRGMEIVRAATDRVLNRTYAPSGRGGLFPLSRAREDQREVELWYQMQAYLQEVYYD